MSLDANDADSRGMRLLLRGRPRPTRETPLDPPPQRGDPVVVAAVAPVVPVTPQPSALPLCVRIPAAGQMLGVGRSTIYELINAGELETIKLGAAVLIPTTSIQSFVLRHARTARNLVQD